MVLRYQKTEFVRHNKAVSKNPEMCAVFFFFVLFCVKFMIFNPKKFSSEAVVLSLPSIVLKTVFK